MSKPRLCTQCSVNRWPLSDGTVCVKCQRDNLIVALKGLIAVYGRDDDFGREALGGARAALAKAGAL